MRCILSICVAYLVVAVMPDEVTTIRIKKETATALKEIGKKGETYDDIVNRLLDRVLRRKRKG